MYCLSDRRLDSFIFSKQSIWKNLKMSILVLTGASNIISFKNKQILVINTCQVTWSLPSVTMMQVTND